eukprot:TRINITY_DN12273_c0_g1_i1.p1 TRINITY_DN12273_c0_g1~~TRINITY_DN12273_c0_g1_i1.p1  ORF type:complete len:260 (-),score=31.64 TRINITY_DN12273_c0_g1_i1:3-686(-)
MNTGDLLLGHGTTTMSRAMEFAMQCYFSHTSVIVRDPPKSVLQAYGQPVENIGVHVWEAHKAVDGCRLLPLREWLDIMKKRHGEDYFLVWRQLRGAQLAATNLEALWRMAEMMHDTKFQHNTAEMLMAIPGWNSKETPETVFCSEAAALAYKALGLFSQEENASNWVTGKFASEKVNNALSSGKLESSLRLTWPPPLQQVYVGPVAEETSMTKTGEDQVYTCTLQPH